MIEIGIPVYNAKETLPALLDTIVTQTRKTIIVCLSIDGDGLDYSDIINTYSQRGLKFRVIESKENGGPGVARQRVIDTTQCDYIMFADADDLLMPRAVEILYRGIINSGYDILRSHFIREQQKQDLLLKAKDATITWFHGKIYRTQYLRSLGVRMPSYLRADEDAYFNLIAWYGTEKRGYVDEITYIWRDNKQSITRSLPEKEYFIKFHHYYIRSQVEALKFIFNHKIVLDDMVITLTLINLYYYYMHALYYRCNIKYLNDLLYQLHSEEKIIQWLGKPQTWIDVINNIKTGMQVEDGNIIFFQETFNVWIQRVLKGES